jgi:hypothetical protein
VGWLAGRYGTQRASNDWLLYLPDDSPTQHNKINYPHTIAGDGLPCFYLDMLYRHPFAETELHDTQACALCHAAARFFSLSQILVLQTPLSRLPEACAWFLSVSEESEPFTSEEQELIKQIKAQLRLTRAMQLTLDKGCLSFKKRGGKLSEVLQTYTTVIITGKQERAGIFEQLKQSLA